MNRQNVIIKVEKGSIGEELGIEKGDILLDINGNIINDVFDYRYFIQDEFLEVAIKKTNGEEWVFEIEKDEYEDLGITFESGLMDKAKSCSNKCIFCFIDQLPKGMRETLYFKDDDSRLSFLQGNYVTLTNMKDEDINRIIYYHLSPINISVHTTNMELREQMLKNPKAVNVMSHIKKFYDSNIEMNFQVVLCRNINDKFQLEKTINDLSKFIPKASSLSIVPLGVTKYRENLYNFELFDKESSLEVINQVEYWQKKLKNKYGKRFVFASDEFYLKAEKELPKLKEYEDFPQLENGVGMLTLMKSEFENYFSKLSGDSIKRNLTLATGKAAYSFISELCNEISRKFTNTNIKVFLIENDFFGENITVSGLLTGKDIINQLKDKKLSKYLFIPGNSLRTDDTVFLDDIDIKDIERELEVKVIVSDSNGENFIKQILNTED